MQTCVGINSTCAITAAKSPVSGGGTRQRDVCRGYGVDCASGPVGATLPYHDTGISGTATAGAAGLIQEDSATDFLQRDVIPGDTIFNTTDWFGGDGCGDQPPIP